MLNTLETSKPVDVLLMLYSHTLLSKEQFSTGSDNKHQHSLLISVSCAKRECRSSVQFTSVTKFVVYIVSQIIWRIRWHVVAIRKYISVFIDRSKAGKNCHSPISQVHCVFFVQSLWRLVKLYIFGKPITPGVRKIMFTFAQPPWPSLPNENVGISTQNLLYLGLYKRYNGASSTKLGVYIVRQFNGVIEI